ncbi:MAG: hypothetical protein OEZ41_12535 [Nitrospirota bacterium]|nr:hypothetical protein [Nitrospirota bacterium]MDH5700773.1 hypothetical protein [Nitrospirota bacterium]
MPNLSLRHILGVDAVCEVVELGEGVTNLRKQLWGTIFADLQGALGIRA